MTHYDITIGNDVARDVHYEMIMGHSIVVGTYHDVTVILMGSTDIWYAEVQLTIAQA